MFELHVSSFGRFRRYDFVLPEVGHGFSVVPAAGATLVALQHEAEPVLDSYETSEALEIGLEAKGALLFPFPNRLREGRYSWLGRQYVFPINDPQTNTAIHGFICREVFQPVRIELTDEHAEIACRLDYEGSHPGYPFPFTMGVTYSMTLRSLFGLQVWVKNRHTEPIPLGFGWHPYFRLGKKIDDYLLKLPPCSREILDERKLPILKQEPFTAFEQMRPLGKEVFDACFRAAEHLTLYDVHLRGERRAVTISLSRTLFPFFQIFTPPTRQSLAIEPMTCLINAFENGEGITSLAPGHVWSAAFVLHCETV
ncbi:MAG: hypothetical protein NZM43_01755 [Saprospiraceae bacterium]|nr:hypothetical protein [Saprospiraceae bacterium]MDW8483026.1 hypothetical protein [Saprospiraceae bacterium]